MPIAKVLFFRSTPFRLADAEFKEKTRAKIVTAAINAVLNFLCWFSNDNYILLVVTVSEWTATSY